MATSDVTAPPQTTGGRLRQVGPGLLVAAAGVGAGDLVATMVAGAEFGTVLLWAAVLGTVLKIGLAEGVGRWTLASGATMLDGWRLLGRWTTVFFGIYIVVWGFAYGATAMGAVGLPLNALFGGLSVRSSSRSCPSRCSWARTSRPCSTAWSPGSRRGRSSTCSA